MANTYHDQLTGSDLHTNKIDATTGTELTLASQSTYDSRWTRQTRTISTTSPLTGGGDLSANRTLSIPAATSSSNGYLTLADWTTFNGKGNRAAYIVGPNGSTGNDYTANGTADDAALRSALQSNRTVFVKDGTYNLTAPINLSGKSHIRLIAESQSVIFQIPSASLNNFHFSYMLLGDATSDDIIVDGVRFYGNYSNYISPPSSGGGGIAPQTRWIVKNCVIEDFAYFGLWLGASCSDTKILYNRFVGPGHGEDHIGGGSANHIEIAYNTWESNIFGNAFDNVKGSHYSIHHNVNKSAKSIFNEGITYFDFHHNDLQGGAGIGILSDNGYGPVSITNTSNVRITDNHLNGGSITFTCTNSLTKTATISGNVTITGNIIDTPTNYGILLQADSADVATWGENYIVANNTILNANDDNSTTFNTGHGVIHPSGINVSQLRGIVIANNCCIDNRISPQQRYGIEIGQTFTPSATTEPNGVILIGNYVSGYVTAPTVRVSPTYTTDYTELTSNNGTLEITSNLALKNANSKITGATGLVLEETGDISGTARFSLQNRSNVNGILLEQAGTADVIEAVFKGISSQQTIRYENRGGGYVATPEFQIGTTSDPALVVSATGTLVRKGYFKISGAFTTPLTTKTATYTLTATDSVILTDATSGAFIVTLPTAVGVTGRQYTIKKIDASVNAVTIASTAGNIDGAATKALSAQWSYLSLISSGSDWVIVSQGGTIT